VWDAASARVVEVESFGALATSRVRVACSLGYPDRERLPPAEMVGALTGLRARSRTAAPTRRSSATRCAIPMRTGCSSADDRAREPLDRRQCGRARRTPIVSATQSGRKPCHRTSRSPRRRSSSASPGLRSRSSASRRSTSSPTGTTRRRCRSGIWIPSSAGPMPSSSWSPR
ncbi:MAG: isocitrate lyase/phosphoenolpyruvate mutase family protein, partial [Bauldia sp.]|nr:isocitrate lyase/phosphoenolpyruvate mutase family protein [Bauldia sp.]